MNNLINAHIQNLTSKCLLPRFMSPQSCASLTSVWSTHLGSLTSWWRGQTGPGELLFHQISRVFVENREEEEEEDRATVKKIYIEKEKKDPVWFWWLKNGGKTSCLECPSQRPRSRHTWHRGACGGHLCISFPSCLRVRGTHESGWVLSTPRGCLITCLSAFNKFCVHSQL